MSQSQVFTERRAGPAPATPSPFVCFAASSGPESGWVHLTGALDVATVPQLQRTLRRRWLQTAIVVVDLREVSFMDSSGVHAIVDASIGTRLAGRRLIVLRGIPAVDRMFALTGCLDDVEIADLEPAEPAVQVLLQLARA